MELSLLQLLLASLLVAFGCFIQGALGFGLALAVAPLLFLIHPDLVPGPVLFLAMVISVIILWRNRAGLAIGEMGSALLGRVPGMLLALWVLSFATSTLLSLILGGAVLLGVAASLSRWHITPTRNTLITAGLLSGFMGTSTSIGGPPMALVYQNARGDQVRANLGGFFLVGTVMSLAGLTLLGHYGHHELLLSLALTPAALAGLALSRHAIGWVDAGRLRPALLALCTLSGVAVIIDGLLAL
ncbi:sulfite exporter TauE/SafE family protein [Alkalilimnicola ehrlichii]|uniref:sulfite exporter TauE/SafE family protein n=1 Tax=Alkalilimnicola ehrlichii TaxID=351052 RepID=UPI003B9E1FE1